MSIKHVILGFLSETPLTGYDLKKKFSSSEVFHWSGNNNQIYRALVELHNEKLVTLDVHNQEGKPARKVYSITDQGLAALRSWVQTPPELPQFQNPFLMQLTWANQLEIDALNAMLTQYEDELQVHLAMLREQSHRQQSSVQTKSSTFSFAERIATHWNAFYQLELDWVRVLRQELEQH